MTAEGSLSDEPLSLSEASFRAMVEGSPDALAVHRDGRFVYVNRRCVELLGYESAEELLGTPVAALVHPDDRPSVLRRVQSLLAGAASVPFAEERLLRRDGSVLSLSIAGMRVVLEGRPAVVAIARDASDQRRTLAKMAHAERMAAIGLLAAGVAHEINNPLTYVMLHLENMARALKDFPQASGDVTSFAKAVDEARFGIERVGAIVRDLRSFARDSDAEEGVVSLARVLDIAVNLTSHELRYRASLARSGNPRAVFVAGREGKLCQVFVNLLINAAQALPSDRAETNEIGLHVSEGEDGSVRIDVTDNGPGIDESLMPTLFEPFMTTKGVSGSGLGLSICREIVTAHGGHIEARSTFGRGATFSVHLPRASEPAAPVSSRRRFDEPESLERARVLVIEDEDAILDLLREILGETYDLACARNGLDAQALLLNDRTFDLVLCDMKMPLFSGMQLYAWIEREIPELSGRILFMSGGDLCPPGRELFEREPSRFLAKPFTRTELQTRLARSLRTWSRTRA